MLGRFAGRIGGLVMAVTTGAVAVLVCSAGPAAATEHGPPNAIPGEVQLTVVRYFNDPSGATLKVSYVDTPPAPPSPCTGAACSPNFQKPYNIKVWIDKADGTSAGGSWTLLSTSLPSAKCQSGSAAPAVACDSGGRNVDNTDDALPDQGTFVLRAQQAPPAEATAEIVVEGYTINTDATVPVPGDPCSTARGQADAALEALNTASLQLRKDSTNLAQDDVLLFLAARNGLEGRQTRRLVDERDKLVEDITKDRKDLDAALARDQAAQKRLQDCGLAPKTAVAARAATRSSDHPSAASAALRRCTASAYATGSRDAALIARSPKLTPLVRKIIRERRTGSAGARQAGHDLKRLRQVLRREQKLAKAISSSLKPCTSG